MAAAAPTSKFVLVKSTSPRQPSGLFRRADLAFTREWRAVEVSAEPEDLEREIPRISAQRYKRLEDETMLACRPATEKELERAQLDAAEAAGKDPAVRIAELQAKNADLEARLLKLELGAKGTQKG